MFWYNHDKKSTFVQVELFSGMYHSTDSLRIAFGMDFVQVKMKEFLEIIDFNNRNAYRLHS